MEAAELACVNKARDNHLDVHIRRVVTEIDETFRFVTQLLRRQKRGAPILNHRGVEGRLIDFVFRKNRPFLRQTFVNLLHRGQVTLELAAHMGLSRKIRAVPDPYRQRF
jgi:hypothetical protein